MKESDQISEVTLTIDPMVIMYMNRLSDLQTLKTQIVEYTLPIKYWEEISIHPKGEAKGLCYGVEHAIFDAWDNLRELGFQSVADRMMGFK